MPHYLLFQATTPQQVAGCRYFLLKYLALYNLKPPTTTAIVVYTNTPVAFENFTPFFSGFDMRDATNLALTKTALLHQFLQQHSSAVLYCDSRTYPLQPLEPLFLDIEKGSVYLHSPHRFSETELAKAMRSFTAPRDKTTMTVEQPPTTRTTVWNTAVIGLNSAHKETIEILVQQDNALANTLALDYHYTKVLSEPNKLKSAAKAIFEWSRLPEFGELLERFFQKNDEESIPNQLKALHHIDAANIIEQKEAYLQQPLFKKWLQIITGKKWSIRQYESRW